MVAGEEEEEAVTQHTRSYAATDRRLTKGRSRWTERAAKEAAASRGWGQEEGASRGWGHRSIGWFVFCFCWLV